MKAYWSRGIAHSFLKVALDGGKVSFKPRPLYPQGTKPVYTLKRKLGVP
jgi:hypothetical protein